MKAKGAIWNGLESGSRYLVSYAYTERQWDLINAWVKAHAPLIRFHGLLFAEWVASRAASNFSERLRDGEWSPCVGVKPSLHQIFESMKVQRLTKKTKADLMKGGRQ